MSIEQLAIDTKIPRASIEALEEDRFAALPGPVFVRGFFRCCARSLGLDPESVIAILAEHLRVQQAGAKSSRRPPAVHAVRGASAAKPALSAAPAEAARPVALSWIEGVGPAILRALSQVPHTRTLMWIAVCMVIAVVAMTAFAMSGMHLGTPHS